MPTSAGKQETAMTQAISNSKDDSNSATAHNSRKGSNSRNESNYRMAYTVGTEAKGDCLQQQQ